MTDSEIFKSEMTDVFLCFFMTKDGVAKLAMGIDSAAFISETELNRIQDLVSEIFVKVRRQKEGGQILTAIDGKKTLPRQGIDITNNEKKIQ